VNAPDFMELAAQTTKVSEDIAPDKTSAAKKRTLTG